jgi:hypothetical protein
MATNPATPEDLANRSLRALSDAEVNAGAYLLDDAYTIVITRLPSVSTRLDAAPGSTFQNLVVRTVCAMVLRVINNPTGLLEEGIDDYTSRYDAAVSTGALYISEDELALLAESGSSANAFTIRPAGRTSDDVFTPDRVLYW